MTDRSCRIDELAHQHQTFQKKISHMPFYASDMVDVTIIKGTDLVAADFGNKSSDPYVILTSPHTQHKTEIIKKNLNPEWNETFTYYLSEAQSELELKFKVMDWDRFSKDVSLFHMSVENVVWN